MGEKGELCYIQRTVKFSICIVHEENDKDYQDIIYFWYLVHGDIKCIKQYCIKQYSFADPGLFYLLNKCCIFRFNLGYILYIFHVSSAFSELQCIITMHCIS